MGRPLSKKYFGPVEAEGPQIAAQAWLGGDSQARLGYIVRQVGTNRYIVNTSFGEDECQLVDTITQPGQMTVQVVAEGTDGIQSARKITDREVYTWTNNNYYPYWNSVNGQIIYGNPPINQYWFGLYGDTTVDQNDSHSQGITFDSQGNMFIGGGRIVDDLRRAYVVKLDTSSNIVWEKDFTSTSTSSVECIMSDGSTNVYVAIVEFDTDSAVIIKLNGSGSIIWQRKIVDFGGPFDITVDTDGSVAIASSNNDYVNVAKYNSSGVLQWIKSIGNNEEPYGYPGIGFTTGGKIALSMAYFNMGGIILSSLNVDGTLEWSKSMVTSVYPFIYTALDTDASGNIYVQTYNSIGEGEFSGIFAKFQSDGTIVWQKDIISEDGFNAPLSIIADATGNTYSFGYGFNSSIGLFGLILVKHNSDGDLEWQRIIGCQGSFDKLASIGNRDVAVYGDSVAVAGYGQEDNAYETIDAIIAKLPNDGSRIGVYGAFIYAETPNIQQNASRTTDPHIPSVINGGYVESAASMSVSNFVYEFKLTNVE